MSLFSFPLAFNICLLSPDPYFLSKFYCPFLDATCFLSLVSCSLSPVPVSLNPLHFASLPIISCSLSTWPFFYDFCLLTLPDLCPCPLLFYLFTLTHLLCLLSLLLIFLSLAFYPTSFFPLPFSLVFQPVLISPFPLYHVSSCDSSSRSDNVINSIRPFVSLFLKTYKKGLRRVRG